MTLNNTICSDTAEFLYENWVNGNKHYILGYISAKTPNVVAHLVITMMETARTHGASHIFAADFRALLETRIEITEGSSYV